MNRNGLCSSQAPRSPLPASEIAGMQVQEPQRRKRFPFFFPETKVRNVMAARVAAHGHKPEPCGLLYGSAAAEGLPEDEVR